ncbi:alpha/beta fold hydrolase [Streptomyces sp. NPDC059176]|uniref:alpha/beta fold hydrolase n=1 Tax=Streptomyces sp. NPDC059176 TaxID=3346758 RepID=UPI00369BD395
MLTTDDGVRLWAERTGRGEPLVLCHGGPGLWDMFREVAGQLADRAAVYRWDQRGCGRSERRGPYSLARSVADLESVRRHFGLERMALLGHSWGATLALRYALEHPDRVARLVYVSGTGIGPDAGWHPAYRRAFARGLGPHRERWEALQGRPLTETEERESCVLRWSVEFPDVDRALQEAARMATPWYGVNVDCNRTIAAELSGTLGTQRWTAECAALRVPVTIVDGALDIRPRSAVDSLESALPHVERIVLGGAGHMPWVEDPGGFRTAVLGGTVASGR